MADRIQKHPVNYLDDDLDCTDESIGHFRKVVPVPKIEANAKPTEAGLSGPSGLSDPRL